MFILDNLWLGGAAIVIAVLAYGGLAVYSAMMRLGYERNIRARHIKEMDLAIDRAQRRQQDTAARSLSWSGTRKFVVARRVVECADETVCSFYLEPHDGKPISGFEPGQFLTFELKVPGEKKEVTRCYSLSDAPIPGVYRVSIKRVPAPRDVPEAPPGLSSNFFHDAVKEGDILDVRAPSGKFFLDMASDRPVVLIGGGVGLTPVLSMLNAVVASGSDREVWFFYGVRSGIEHCMREHIEAIRAEHSNIHIQICYSDPSGDDVQGKDYDHAERVSVELFKRVLPSNNFEYLMCGPPPMMESLINDLREWGVPEQDIKRESFGPASGRKAPVKPVDPNATGPEIVFKRAGKTVHWDPSFDSLVKFAEANDCDIPYACLAGNCGTCLTTLIEGEVDYQGNDPDFEAEEGTCLACSCIPKGRLVLDV